MQVELSEVLACPACDSPQGLVVMVEELDGEGRVREGELGCARCQRRFPVEDGLADLRVEAGEGEGGAEPTGPGAGELAVEVAALLDARSVRGVVVLGRGLAAAGPRVAELADGARLLCLTGPGEAPPGAPESPRVALARSPSDALPVLPGKAAGVALWRPSGGLAERGRVALAPGGRLVVLRPDAAVREDLEASDLEVVASEERAVVGRRVG